uniref:Putative secreted protein n=1 Tax=Anopheles marajoara TaxID=58244 RepID=A0A2M4C665_9DIPT
MRSFIFKARASKFLFIVAIFVTMRLSEDRPKDHCAVSCFLYRRSRMCLLIDVYHSLSLLLPLFFLSKWSQFGIAPFYTTTINIAATTSTTITATINTTTPYTIYASIPCALMREYSLHTNYAETMLVVMSEVAEIASRAHPAVRRPLMKAILFPTA